VTALTERRRIVLRAVVDHHVKSNAPVGSRILAQRYVATVSPATIRSELGALEDRDLLYQPHTSAGRLPTQAGYRRVVDDILSLPSLSIGDNASAAYPHQELHRTLRSPCNYGNSLLFAEFFKTVAMNLSAVTNSLALLSVVLSPRTNFGSAMHDAPDAGLVMNQPQLYYNGLANLLSQPEFLAPGSQEGFAHLVRMLENENELIEVLETSTDDRRVTVSIGKENVTSGLSRLSLVACRYRIGVIAVVGPTRMKYRDAISAVSTAAHVLDDVLD